MFTRCVICNEEVRSIRACLVLDGMRIGSEFKAEGIRGIACLEHDISFFVAKLKAEAREIALGGIDIEFADSSLFLELMDEVGRDDAFRKELVDALVDIPTVRAQLLNSQAIYKRVLEVAKKDTDFVNIFKDEIRDQIRTDLEEELSEQAPDFPFNVPL